MEISNPIHLDMTTIGCKFGQDCPTCKQQVVYMASVAYCHCNIHFHQKCFNQALNQLDLTDEPKISCKDCKYQLTIQYEVDMQPKFNKERCLQWRHLFLLIITFFFSVSLGISISVLIQYSGSEDDVKAAVACVVLALSILGIGSMIFRIFIVFFIKKMVSVTSVKPIEKSLEFSAFKNIHDLEPQSDHKLTPF